MSLIQDYMKVKVKSLSRVRLFATTYLCTKIVIIRINKQIINYVNSAFLRGQLSFVFV